MSWLFRLFRRSEAESQLDDEIRFHLEQEAQLRRQRGEAPAAAAQAARRDFGNVGLVKEVTREAWGWALVEDLARDLRHSVRMLGRSPVFAAVASVSLALGIGANTAIFSLADAVIFRELPVRDPKGLYQVRAVHQRGVETIYSYPMYREIRDRNRVFSATVGASSWAIPELVEIDGRELRPRITAVSGNYFETLGIQPAIGRLFTPADDRVTGVSAKHAWVPEGVQPVAVISYRFWRQAFDSSPGVTSAKLLHNGASYQILGVAAPGFTGVSSSDDPDIWVPMMMVNSVLRRGDQIKNPDTSSLIVFGRLKPGVTAAEASAGVAAVYREMQPTDRHLDGKRGEAVSMARGVQSLRANFERPLLVLLGLAGLLLLITCANLAALLTARAMARRHEIAVRKSLGASTLRLMRQFLTESLLIAVAGGVAGLLVSSWAASLLVGIVTTSTRRLPIHIAVDMRMLAVATVISGVAALLFGLLPAIQANRIGSSARTPSRLPASRFLCAGQLALSLFLLVVAGLFARSLGNLRGLDTGFVREKVLVLQLDPVVTYGEDKAKYLALYEKLVERVEALPGVRSASMSSATFFGGSSSRGNITYEGQGGEAPRSEWPFKVRITPKFHETLGLSMPAGRAFTVHDNLRAPLVAIVSESVARRNFPGGNAVGKHFCFSETFAAKCGIEIVGVARDVSYSSLRGDSPYVVYLPIQQNLSQRPDLQVRTWANPVLLSADVQRVIRQYDSNLRVTYSVALERLVEDSIVQDRLVAILASSFGLLALVLSAVGLYGITAYGVQARTREIGVRIALGATSAKVRWLVLREVLVLLVVGVALAVPAAWAASSIVRGLLFGLTPADPLAIGGAILALGGTGILAGYLPSRRASRIDPIHALRIE